MCTETALNKIINEVKEECVKLFSDGLKNIILYGSYARGDYDGESDIDIFVLVDMPQEEFSKYNNDIVKLSSRLSLENENCITVSIALQDLKVYNKYKEFLPYYMNINSEGVVLYAA